MCRHDHVAEFKRSLPEPVREQLRTWARVKDDHPVIRRTNFYTQVKVGLIYAAFFAALTAYVVSGGHAAVAAVGIAVLGLLAISFLRVFMHTQAHWKFGNGPIRNWLLDHGLSILFSVPQTGYKYGHLAHHRYDNDYDPSGFPKDLQSTYIFSRNRRPTNLWLWCVFYLVVYQHAVHLFHVLNAPKRREIAWYAFEYLLIAAFHAGVYWLSPGFYLTVYLPALALAWCVAAVSLYMMHAVDLDEYEVHPTLNSHDPWFNWFGDNDGYHLEHSLFPNLHPAFLKMASDLIQPPEQQVLSGQYVTAALERLFQGPLSLWERVWVRERRVPMLNTLTPALSQGERE
jgi:fatty acid desaturase